MIVPFNKAKVINAPQRKAINVEDPTKTTHETIRCETKYITEDSLLNVIMHGPSLRKCFLCFTSW